MNTPERLLYWCGLASGAVRYRPELPGFPIVVHHDEFRAELSRDLLDCDDNAFLLTTGTPISWGDFGVDRRAECREPVQCLASSAR